jgi:nuclear pore complex protein Nup210
MQSLSPQLGETSFEGWCDRASKAVAGLARKSLNSVILGAWTLWNHRNHCVFNRVSPNLNSSALSLASDKLRLGRLQVQRYFLADWSAAQMSEF